MKFCRSVAQWIIKISRWFPSEINRTRKIFVHNILNYPNKYLPKNMTQNATSMSHRNMLPLCESIASRSFWKTLLFASPTLQKSIRCQITFINIYEECQVSIYYETVKHYQGSLILTLTFRGPEYLEVQSIQKKPSYGTFTGFIKYPKETVRRRKIS